MPDSYDVPPAGTVEARPRRDLRGHRLGPTALIERSEAGLRAKRWHGFIGGFAGGLAVGAASLWVGLPAVAAVIAALAVNVLLTLWLPTRLIPAADRRLLTVTGHVVRHLGLTWRRAYGRTPMPRTEEQRLLWLAAQPATTTDPDALGIEGSIFLSLGRYSDARDRAQRMPSTTPFWRFERALAFAAIDFDSGGPGDLEAAQEALAQLHGERKRVATVGLGLEEAVHALVRGEDWSPPIERAVAAAGPSIAGGITVGLGRLRVDLRWILASELALGTILYFVAVRPPA